MAANHIKVPDYKKLFEAAPGLFLVLLPDPPTFTIVAVSDAYLKATGKKRDEVLGQSLFQVFSDNLTSPHNPLAKGLHNLRDSLMRALSLSISDRLIKQTQHGWDLVNTPVLAETGEVLNVIHSIDKDSGEDKAALQNAKAILEARVIERTEDLMRSNIDLEQFAYIASHDLQTPLRHISSYVQLLTTKIKKTTELDPKTEKWIEYILSGTRQMKSLISDLLSYSRVGRVDIKVEQIDVAKVIVHVLEDLRDTIVTTRAEINYDELPKIFGINSQIEQLFQNLIENALKFRNLKNDPIKKIRCEDEGDLWKFSVADNGIGINPKYFERIFLMFHRLHSNSEYVGTGIGLAICKKNVEFHGGKIGIDSAEGKGTTFYFNIPKQEQITSMARQNILIGLKH